MTSFSQRDGLYGVRIITGPRLSLLRFELLDERIEDFEVAAYTTDGLNRNPTAAVVRTRVLESTDEASGEFGTSYHPWLARYVVFEAPFEFHRVSNSRLSPRRGT